MKVKFLVIFGFFLCASKVSANANNAVCLATLAHYYAWSDDPRGEQQPYGTYLGSFGIAYGFSSYDKENKYFCRITGTKVELSATSEPWEIQPGVTHRYRREGADIAITTKEKGKTSYTTKYDMREVLGRMKEMEASLE